MTDITAQAFRNAAAQLYESLGSPWRDLLLAAAEQREQLDAANAQLDLYMAENEELSQQVVDLGLWNASQREQIATLTAENETLRHQWETTRVTLIDVQTYAQKQLATLTAELEAVKAERISLKSLTLKEERDEARTALAQAVEQIRVLREAK